MEARRRLGHMPASEDVDHRALHLKRRLRILCLDCLRHLAVIVRPYRAVGEEHKNRFKSGYRFISEIKIGRMRCAANLRKILIFTQEKGFGGMKEGMS